MAELGPEIVGEVLAACKAGAAEAAGALGRALDAPVEVSVGEPGSFDADSPPEGFSGPGLAIVLTVGDSAALVLLPESTGLVPEWCAAPDATGQSKLTTLAQELGMILLPEQSVPEDFKTARVEDLAGALARGGVSGGAAMVPLELSGPEGKQGTAMLVWPASKPAAVIGAGESKPEAKAQPAPESEAEPEAGSQPGGAGQSGAAGAARHMTARDLPHYTRSLLRVKIPLVVTLASKRQALWSILELGPGSILHFDKSCEEMLELNAGGHLIASGEAVKVGDKFGLRITSVRLPDERFKPIKKGTSRGRE